jgi:hypothetical protein
VRFVERSDTSVRDVCGDCLGDAVAVWTPDTLADRPVRRWYLYYCWPGRLAGLCQLYTYYFYFKLHSIPNYSQL